MSADDEIRSALGRVRPPLGNSVTNNRTIDRQAQSLLVRRIASKMWLAPPNPIYEIALGIRHPVLESERLIGLLEVRRQCSEYFGFRATDFDSWMEDLQSSGLQKDLEKTWLALWKAKGTWRRLSGGPCLENAIQYVILRALRPERVVETGVAYGFSSAYALQALSDNKKGKLVSLDYPSEIVPEILNVADESLSASSPGIAASVGKAVPLALRDRWTLILGKSEEKLPPLLDSLGTVDVFFHDSLHTRENMLYEFGLSWGRIRPGGLLLSDDVNLNDAWDAFCANARLPDFRWIGRVGQRGALSKRVEEEGENLVRAGAKNADCVVDD